MTAIDWVVVAAYALLVTGIGLAFKKRASAGVDDYFLSGRQLPWWLAGTSLVATAFASDTPLFVTGLVREHGIAGNWHWWFMALASVASLFVFARLWRRARVVTDVELIELRYGAGAGAALRGVKAVFLGVVFNVYALGAWPVLGLSKVLEEVTSLSKVAAVLSCSGLALAYCLTSGLWGVVVTDLVQLALALVGAIVLAALAVDAAGGLDAVASLPQAANLLPEHTPQDLWHSPWLFFLSLMLIQWWARGFEGDGVAVQRLSACKNERHAFYAMIWFNVLHYAVRAWPWILVALASLIVLPSVTDAAGGIDHERAYPRMILALAPAGVAGLMIASFFAAFMSTVDTHLNWGASYVVNDVYKRFVKPDAPQGHYVLVARVTTVLLMAGGVVIALGASSIVDAFYDVLLLFSGVGLVGVARWLWWRVNAWTEITAMVASGALTLLAPTIAGALGAPADARPAHLLVVLVGSTVAWLAATLLTRPADDATLIAFYRRVRPPGPGWARVRRLASDVVVDDRLRHSFVGWIGGVAAILGATLAIGLALLGRAGDAALAAATAAAGVGVVRVTMRRMRWPDEAPPGGPEG